MSRIILSVFLICLFLSTGCKEINQKVIVKFKTSEILSEELTLSNLTDGFPGYTLSKITPLVPEESIAKIEEIMSENSIISEEAIEAEGNSMGNLVLLEFSKIKEGQQSFLLAKVKQNPDVEYAELDTEITADETVPNDPSYSSQKNICQLIGLNRAWDETKGNKSVIVAVIDSGVKLDHPDLKDNLIPGYDFANEDSIPDDDAGHGTRVAGIIGAVGNNNAGIAGINWNVSIMPLKFMTKSGSTTTGYTSNAVRAIYHAIANRASIINCSWGQESDSQSLREAFGAAQNSGVLIVTSAGNSSANNDSTKHFPSNYHLGNMIVVAASNSYDQLASFSNFGSATVDLAAPGSAITTTDNNGGYTSYASGTSFSSPHVAGTAALVQALHPNWRAVQLRNAILNSVDKVSSLQNLVATGGRLNCYKAVTYGNPLPQEDFIIITSAPKISNRIFDVRPTQNFTSLYRFGFKLANFAYELKQIQGSTVTVQASYTYDNNSYPANYKDIGQFVAEAQANESMLANGNVIESPTQASYSQIIDDLYKRGMLPVISIKGIIRSSSGQTTEKTIRVEPEYVLGSMSVLVPFADNNLWMYVYATEQPGTAPVCRTKTYKTGYGNYNNYYRCSNSSPDKIFYAYTDPVPGTTALYFVQNPLDIPPYIIYDSAPFGSPLLGYVFRS